MDEAELIRRWRAGDAEAPALLLDLHGDRLTRSAYLLCRDRSEAQDLAQETFLIALRSFGRFRGGSKLYTWLFGILFNLVRNRRRRAGRLLYSDQPPEPEPAPPQIVAAHDRALASAELLRALDLLSDEHREVIVLRFYEELAIDEIAACLDVPAGTVKSRLHHALKYLREKLPPHVNLFSSTDTHT